MKRNTEKIFSYSIVLVKKTKASKNDHNLANFNGFLQILKFSEIPRGIPGE